MNRQRKVVITVTYNDLGTIVDTKAEELNLSAQPEHLMDDLISRQAAIDEIKEIYEWHDSVTKERIIEHFKKLPSAHPKPYEDMVSRQRLSSDLKKLVAAWKKYPVMAKQIKGVEAAIEYVEAIPSARKRGEWIDYTEDGYVECPFCHSATNCDGNKDELHFCFSCGADMRGADHEND